MFCAEPWLNEVLSTGWKLVSLRLSKPVANSIWGIEHEPKSPIAELAAAGVLAAAEEVAAAAEAVTVTVTTVWILRVSDDRSTL